MIHNSKKNITKLPVWAQELIASYEAHVVRLSNKVKELQTQLQQALTGSATNSSAVTWSKHMEHWFSLPNDAIIKIKNPDDSDNHKEEILVTIRKDLNGFYLDINKNSALHIEPAATNHIKIIFKDKK